MTIVNWPEPSVSLARALEGLRQESASLDHIQAWPELSFRVLDQADVLGWVIPGEYGGGGISGRVLVEGYLHLSRACLVTAFVLTQRNGACQRFAASENEELKQDLLPGLTGSEVFATVGVSHLTTSRQHLDRPAVHAEPVDGGYRLSGTVPWVTGAERADWILTGGTCPDGRQVLLSLPGSAPGVTTQAAVPLLALDGSQTVSVELEDVFIEDRLLVAGPCEAIMHSGGRGGTGSLGTSALALGAAAGSLDRMGEEVQRRPELAEAYDPLCAELEGVVADTLAASSDQAESDDPAFSNESIRHRANSLVLRCSQAYLAAAKGAGFTAGHPAARAVREAMFFLVWSCPQAVVAAQLREFACGVQFD